MVGMVGRGKDLTGLVLDSRSEFKKNWEAESAVLEFSKPEARFLYRGA